MSFSLDRSVTTAHHDDIGDRLGIDSAKTELEVTQPQIKKSQNSYKNGVLSFLTNVPIAKNAGIVKAYSEKVSAQNSLEMSSFIGGLSKRLGADAVSRGVQITGIRPGDKLTKRRVRALTHQAETSKLAGESKHLARNVNLRIWEGHSMSAPGHVSVTLKNGIGVVGQVLEKDTVRKTHVSWWPGNSENSHPLRRRKAAPNESYVEDKKYEISDKAQKSLSEGKFLPKLGQKKLSDGKWGKSAESLPAPLMGTNFNHQTGRRQFVTFGLNEKAFKADWAKVRNDNEEGKTGYTMISVDENCAGMGARVLKAAGAEVFAPIPKAYLYQDPDSMHEYGITLQREINSWNAKANALSDFFQQSSNVSTNSSKILSNTVPADDFSAVFRQKVDVDSKTVTMATRANLIATTIKSLPSDQAKILTHLSHALAECKVENNKDFISLMQQAKKIVDALHPLVINNKTALNHDIQQILVAANDVLNDIKVTAFQLSR